jgi:predicted nucleic acid-binding protein
MSVREPAFVDTNVLVYAFDQGEKERQEKAAALVRKLTEEGCLLLSTQVLQEFYVTVVRKIAQPVSSAQALSIMDDLAEWPLFTVDYPAIRQAVDLSTSNQLSFWDALVVVSAARSGAKLLYTEDLNHGQEIAKVRICNPFRLTGVPPG